MGPIISSRTRTSKGNIRYGIQCNDHDVCEGREIYSKTFITKDEGINRAIEILQEMRKETP